MDRIDKKIITMAQKEKTKIPVGYENHIDELLSSLSQERSVKNHKINAMKFTRIAAGFALLVTVSICGYMVHAGTTDEQRICIEESELDQMFIIDTNKLNIECNEFGMIEYQWNSYEELQTGLGIKLLRSENEYASQIMEIWNQTDNEDYHIIQIGNFAAIEQSVVNLKISMRCSEEQSVEGLLTEFMGDFQRRGEYISRQGYKVIFVGHKTLSPQSINDDVVDGKLTGVFVADGILYQLSGIVSVNQLKAFIDVLYY